MGNKPKTTRTQKTYNNSNDIGELLKQAGYNKTSAKQDALKGAQRRASSKKATWKDKRHARKLENQAMRQGVTEARIKADVAKMKQRNIAHAITSVSGNIANAITQKNLNDRTSIQQNAAIQKAANQRNAEEEVLEAY